MKCIHIMPIGSVDKPILRFVAQEATVRLDYNFEIMQNTKEPSYAFEPGRKQYLSGRILKRILNCAPEDAVRIMGITEVDLCTPILTFVFGEAQLGGKAAVMSLCRLRQEYYGLPSDPALLLGRAAKEAVHELGHTFRLTHCSNPRCVMHFSNSVRNIDMKTNDFCDGCSVLLSEMRAIG